MNQREIMKSIECFKLNEICTHTHKYIHGHTHIYQNLKEGGNDTL